MTLQPTLIQLMKYTPSGLALANVFVLISQDYWHLPVATEIGPQGFLLIFSVTKVNEGALCVGKGTPRSHRL